MKKSVLLVIVILLLISFSACKHKPKTGIKYDNFSNGKACEVVLVIDSAYWTSVDMDSIYNILRQPQPALNQSEPMFDVLQFSNDDFTAFFQRHRNIVHFDLNSNYSANTLSIDKDQFSSNQVYIHIRGNNADSCMNLFLLQQNQVLEALYLNDLKRLQSFYVRNSDQNIAQKIKEKFGISMTIPYQYTIAREEADFIWLLNRTVKNDRCIMIYKRSNSILTGDSIISNRNFITRAYIPGAIKGAFPQVDLQFFNPIVSAVKVNSKVGLDVRGLWNCVGDHMGGPFVNFSFLDDSKENMISIDGFVYAPEEEKRDYMREVEAIIKSVK